jgi:cellobiose transport system permease protein
MRQYIMGAVHNDLLDAARLDGARFFRMYWSVALPVLRPGLAFLGIFTFVSTWNDYLWPLIVLTNPEKVTLQVALSQLNGTHQLDYSRIVTGALLAMFPLVVVFVIFARGFIADLAKGAFKG